MSSIAVRAPVASAKPPRGWSLRGLYRTWRARRRAREVWITILHAADIYPPG
jgi:hypothetical protein